MGCKSSKEQDQQESLELSFAQVGLVEQDRFWEEVLHQLKTLEKTRINIELLLLDISHLTNSHYLKSQNTLQEQFNMFLWHITASNQGDFEATRLTLQNEQQPYFSCKANQQSQEAQEFKYTWDQLMVNIYQNKLVYDQLCQQVQVNQQQMGVLSAQMQSDCASYPSSQQSIMIKNHQRNVQLYRAQVSRIIAYQSEYNDLKAQVDAILKSFPKNKADILSKAQQLIKNGQLQLDQAIHQHPSPKWSPEVSAQKKKELDDEYDRLQIIFIKISSNIQEKLEKQISSQIQQSDQAKASHLADRNPSIMVQDYDQPHLKTVRSEIQIEQQKQEKLEKEQRQWEEEQIDELTLEDKPSTSKKQEPISSEVVRQEAKDQHEQQCRMEEQQRQLDEHEFEQAQQL